MCHDAPGCPKGGICGGRFSLRLRFQRRASLLGPPGRKGIACGFRSSFISAAEECGKDFSGEVLSRRPTAVLSRLVSGFTTGESWGMYRADATVDIGQTEERYLGGRECGRRSEEVGEVRR